MPPCELLTVGQEPLASWNSKRIPIEFVEPQPDIVKEDENMRRIIDAAVSILDQGVELLRHISTESYTARLPVAFNASIGGHYRHCLDHFASVIRALDDGMIDYDHRERDRRIEVDTAYALSLTRDLAEELRELAPSALRRFVQARCEISYEDGDSPVSVSSLGRELVYAIAHTIHHFALIAVMARLLGIQLPETFGVAPSTIAHQSKQNIPS
jgi:uncharacterized damage-inducible protein DinB